MKKLCSLFFCVWSTSLLAATYETEHFTVQYDDNVPLEIVKKFSQRVENNRQVVLAYLTQSVEYKGTPIKERLIANISKKEYIPYQAKNQIYIPEKRVLAAFGNDQNNAERTGLAVIHELTHVYAVSSYRHEEEEGKGHRFYDDGLAVFLQHRFGESQEFPDFGRDLYQVVAEKALKNKGLVPLADCEKVRIESESGLGRHLAYAQEGAFTQFLIERFGFDTYLKIYHGADIKEVTGESFEELEIAFAALIRSIQA
ncbi:hypothetical protein [Pseudoalteromonas xiamenensis]